MRRARVSSAARLPRSTRAHSPPNGLPTAARQRPSARSPSLRVEAEALSSRARGAADDAEAAAERARAAARVLTEADPQARRRPAEGVLAQLLAGADRLESALAVEVERYEAPVRERAEAQTARTSELGASPAAAWRGRGAAPLPVE